MDEERVRYSLIGWEALCVLRDTPAALPAGEVIAAVRQRIDPTPYERQPLRGGQSRWETALHFVSGDAATVGWMTKRGGWSITEAGIEALREYPDPDLLRGELHRRYRLIDQQRKQAQQNLSGVQQFIAETIGLLGPGTWTAHEDLAELAGTVGPEVAHFLASGNIRLANSYRVLNADGAIPAEGMLNAAYRGTNLRARLKSEGIEFDPAGRASQDQRLTAATLKELRGTRLDEEEPGGPAPAKRAWMVRGSSVDGYNLVPEWLREGFVSLSASQLPPLSPDVSSEGLRQAVDKGYEHKSYAYREQRVAEFDRFLRRMRPGDLVLTTVHGDVYIGEVTGPPVFGDSAQGLSNLRRGVRWAGQPVPADRLAPPVPALLQDQAHVVDLTEAYEQLAALTGPVTPPARPKLAFRAVTAQFADDLFLDQAELATIADLLWERKQIILYGPPGTGKTWLARKLARHLTNDMDGAVRLVQFHPSYTYEDFFEGFRPVPGGGGSLSFDLRPGPFRRLAETAEDDTSTPYVLVIDEINRANLAKVFGELYFLLEYRDESISLQYSPERPFQLPPNLFVIGTMNTADRSIAKVDAAMRRRFAFVELHPRVPPAQGLLDRWLARQELPLWPARVLDALNARIEDADAAIGPSYLMDKRIYEREGGVQRVWKYSIMPLLADLFYGQPDLEERYGLAALIRSTGIAETSQEPGPGRSDPGGPPSAGGILDPDQAE
ncbi:MAG TPA: AAA family ATPase [Streptosporangiaceae bacterium]|nr:AAA family ATPase [Streptosporangiaceae bacterium]